MPPQYIYENSGWPRFRWDEAAIAPLLAALRLRQGKLIGRVEALGLKLRDEAQLNSLTAEVIQSSGIEGEVLAPEQVRSSVARRLGLEIGALHPADRNVKGMVAMVLDATQNYRQPLTEPRIFAWHKGLFPAGTAPDSRIKTGTWRDDSRGPMQVVSGRVGGEKIHFQAPPASRLKADASAFLKWFNGKLGPDPLLKAALAHLWFVTLHPFDDGNGRIARAIADMALARSEQSPRRFYSMSAQIRAERRAYYEILERTQKGRLDVTAWLVWFLACLDRAFTGSDKVLSSVLAKARFWERHRSTPFNARQGKVLNRVLDGFEGKLTSSKWAALAKCSQDTANRDIDDLVQKQVLLKSKAGGRSTSYLLELP